MKIKWNDIDAVIKPNPTKGRSKMESRYRNRICPWCGQHYYGKAKYCSTKCANAANSARRRQRTEVERTMGWHIVFCGYDEDELKRWCSNHHGNRDKYLFFFDQMSFLNQMRGRKLLRNYILDDLKQPATYWPNGTLIKSTKKEGKIEVTRTYIIKNKQVEFYEQAK